MASQVILKALSDILPPDALAGVTEPPSSRGNDSHTPSISALSQGHSVLSLPSLLLSLLVKNQDMLKLFIIGGLIETFRRFAARSWNWFVNSCFLTIYLDDSDDSFAWMMVWLSKQSAWEKARDLRISTALRAQYEGVEIPGFPEDAADTDEAASRKKHRFAYLPAHGTTHWLRYKRTWMSVSRSKEYSEAIEITLFARDHRILRSLLSDAKKAYKPDDQDTVDIYGADKYDDWSRTSTRKSRPLRSIILDPEIKKIILEDANDFLSSEEWYADRGIPYRRGYLLYGIPGSGKTSLIHSIAGELGLDVYVVSLAKKGLDDSILNDLICAIPPRSILLMEDIDAAFHRGTTARNGVSGSSSASDPPTAASPAPPEAQKDVEDMGVTLSGLLGALDGVAAQEGRILFATTNRYEALDEALRRPGRMDIHIEFKRATNWQAKELFRRFFPPAAPSNPEAEEGGEGCEKPKEIEVPAGRAAVHLSEEEADVLASQFAEIVPDGQFSMASLQGHLIRYKTRPRQAVEAAKEWIEKEMEGRSKKVNVEGD